MESPCQVAYLAAGPDKPAFVNVGDQVKKGQNLDDYRGYESHERSTRS